MAAHPLSRRAIVGALILACAATPGPAHAQARHMGWGDSTNGHQELAFDCGSPPAEATLVVSFVAPANDILAIRAYVDLCTVPFELPAWWRFDLAEGCRYGTDELSVDFASGPSTFPVAWTAQTSATKLLQFGHGWSTAMNRWEILIHNANLQPTPLVQGQEYYAFKLTFRTPAGACAGCDMEACFVLNQLDVEHSGGVSQTAMTYENWVNWQGGQANCPFVVPAASTTWGRVKGAYR